MAEIIAEEQPIDDTSPLETTTDNEVSYFHFGKLAAKTTNSNSQLLDGSLDNIYDRFLNAQELTGEGIKNRISKLRAEVSQKKNQKIQANSEIASQEKFKEDKESRIEELEIDKIKIKDGEAPSVDYVPFIIGAFITILLTLYLFVFYSSSGYSAFYGVKQGSLGFINPNVFADAKTKGGGVIALIILFPVIFLGLGFLIHDALEKKKYGFITLLLVFTLVVDAIIGYKISQGIHTNEFNGGLTNEQWKFNMIYNDMNFYLVLALGFVVYVIWGYLLHYVLDKNKELQPDKALELRLENLNRKISEQRQELAEIVSKINSLKAQVETLDNEISEKEKDIIGYENGVIPVNTSMLKASIGDFMSGWFAYTTMMYPKNANKRNQEATEKTNIWLTNKLEALSSDN